MRVKFLENTKYSPDGLKVIHAKVDDYGELKDEMAKKFCDRKWCEPVSKEPEAKEEIVISDVEAPAMEAEEPKEEDDFLGLIDEKPKKNTSKKKGKNAAPENKGG